MADVRTMEFELPGFGGELLRPGDPGYDDARTVFNGMIDRRPAVIARCTSADDVAAAVNVAREQDIALSIYGGGHDVNGSAVVDAGICADLRTMNRVDVDPDQRIARVEGGAKWGAIDASTQEHGLAVTGGRMSDTGIGGLALGSGSGWLERKFGFACDNLVKAEVVTADGRQVIASEDENADLYCGLRGGGGNFGVVTAFHLRLHPVGPILLAGQLMYPAPMAGDLLRFYRDFIVSAPDEVCGGIAFITPSCPTRRSTCSSGTPPSPSHPSARCSCSPEAARSAASPRTPRPSGSGTLSGTCTISRCGTTRPKPTATSRIRASSRAR